MSKSTPISELGEFNLIKHLSRDNETKRISTLVSIGDDSAVLDFFGRHTLISTDLFVEGIHFDLIYFPLKYLGFKTVVASISDIYAMNGQPTQLLISLALSNKFSVEAIDDYYAGVYQACEEFNIDLVGGDTNSSRGGLFINITALGEVAPFNYVSRNGAKKGDLICVTGDLGAAFLGLTLLEREKSIYLERPTIKPNYEDKHHILNKFLRPLPQKNLIDFFEQNQIKPSAMIDISDGLSSEIIHICQQSQVGCQIYEKKIPIDNQTKMAAAEFNIDPTTCALHGGEDYEILFTIAQEHYAKIITNPNISIIGYITEVEKKYQLITKSEKTIDLVAQGWKHIK